MAKRTLVIGDSLGVGTAPTLDKLVKGKVRSNTKVGRSSQEGVALLQQALRGHNFDRIVFDLGTNDASASQLAKSLRQVKRLARGTPVTVATVNGPDAHNKNRVLTNSGLDVVPWAKRSGSYTGSDGIHASAAGYSKRGRMFARHLRGGGTSAGGGGGGKATVTRGNQGSPNSNVALTSTDLTPSSAQKASVSMPSLPSYVTDPSSMAALANRLAEKRRPGFYT